MSRRLLDSNILIYATKPGYEALRAMIRRERCFVSVISRIEVLGYHKLPSNEYDQLNKLFQVTPLIPLSDDITNRAISLRRSYNLSLGDAIIAGTAVEHELLLTTRNMKDFRLLEQLEMTNLIDN